MAAPSSGLSQSSLTRACGPEFCACERDRALQRRDSESIRIKQHKAGQRAAERHPSESERSEKRQSIKTHQWKESGSRNSIQEKKIFCSVPVARCAHSTPSLPWGRMEFDRCAPAAESRAEGAACDPHLKQQGWRRALLVTFPPESSSLQQPLSKHRAPQLWGNAASGTETLLHVQSGSHRPAASSDLQANRSTASGSRWNSEPRSGNSKEWISLTVVSAWGKDVHL